MEISTRRRSTMDVNQVIARNAAAFRRHRQLTQADVAQRLVSLTGDTWTPATVSALERSVNSGRTRKIDGNLLLALSIALRVPLLALLLPMDAVEIKGDVIDFITIRSGFRMEAVDYLDYLDPQVPAAQDLHLWIESTRERLGELARAREMASDPEVAEELIEAMQGVPSDQLRALSDALLRVAGAAEGQRDATMQLEPDAAQALSRLLGGTAQRVEDVSRDQVADEPPGRALYATEITLNASQDAEPAAEGASPARPSRKRSK